MADQKAKVELFERRFRQEMGTRQNLADTKLKVQQHDERRMGLYWQRRKIFDRECLRYRDQPKAIQLAWGLACYLMEKDIHFEDEILAGYYGFTEYRHSLPYSSAEAYQLYLEDKERGIPFDTSLVEELMRMQDACFGNAGSGLHVIGGFRRVIDIGISGMRAELRKGIEKRGETDFLRAGLIVTDAASFYIQRCADQAKMVAAFEATDADRKGRFVSIAKSCDWIAENPPRSFREAVQLVTLLHEIITIEQRCGSLSFGRFDKYMYPFYKRDLDAGQIAPGEAQLMIDSLWSKCADNRWGWQNVTLGGFDEKDGYCANDITRMCLDSSKRLKRDQPQISFRCHETMPDDIWEDIIDLLELGMGFPSLFNDDICIASKVRAGVSKEDAQEYGVLGCVELTIPEKEYSHTEGARINWPKMLEVSLNKGKCQVSGLQFKQKDPRDLNSFRTFDEFYDWFKQEFIWYVDRFARGADEMHIGFGRHFPIPFLSSTMHGCAEKGLDATQSGTIYNCSCINTCGQANLVDSLAAIRKFVFEDRKYTLEQLAEMTARNFEGHERERMYILKNCPRFGSDRECTEIMSYMSRLYCDYLVNLDNRRGGVHEVGYYSVMAQVDFGAKTGALPDGRKKGDVLANGTAPVQGTEKSGLTTVMQAVSQIDCSYLNNGMVLDVKFPGGSFESAPQREKLRDAVKTYFRLGGMEIQINVIDRQTLLEAQKDPGKYRDLVVRVSGFSAYFTDLSAGVQNEIIRRTEFT